MKPYNKNTNKKIELTTVQKNAIKQIQDLLEANKIQLDIVPTKNHRVDEIVAVFKNGDVASIQSVEYIVHENEFKLKH